MLRQERKGYKSRREDIQGTMLMYNIPGGLPCKSEWSWLLTTSRATEFWPWLSLRVQQTTNLFCNSILVTSGRAGYLLGIYVRLPGRNPAAGQPAEPSWQPWSEAEGKPEKCLIQISTRMQKHFPPLCVFKMTTANQTKPIFIFLQLRMETIW